MSSIDDIIGGIARDMDAIGLSLAVKLRAELPGYAVVPVEESRQMIIQEYRNLFAGLIEGRRQNPAEAAHSRLIGRRRAEQGVPVETVLASYHIGLRLAWDELRQRTAAQAPDLIADLLPVVTAIWDALSSCTAAAVEGYEAAAATRRTSRITLMQALLTGLFSGRPDSEAALATARTLGFDPHGEFRAACCPAGDWSAERLGDLQDRLSRRAALAAPLGATLYLVGQNLPEAEMAGLLDVGPVAGFGMLRRGLSGAAESLVDAQRALALAEYQKRVVRFEDNWLPATLLPHLPRLSPLLDAGPAAGQSHLIEAVQSYAGNGFSITEAAKALHIHPNTLKYRLDRWQDLTTWDPRTFRGLLHSLCSMPLSQ